MGDQHILALCTVYSFADSRLCCLLFSCNQLFYCEMIFVGTYLWGFCKVWFEGTFHRRGFRLISKGKGTGLSLFVGFGGLCSEHKSGPKLKKEVCVLVSDYILSRRLFYSSLNIKVKWSSFLATSLCRVSFFSYFTKGITLWGLSFMQLPLFEFSPDAGPKLSPLPLPSQKWEMENYP